MARGGTTDFHQKVAAEHVVLLMRHSREVIFFQIKGEGTSTASFQEAAS